MPRVTATKTPTTYPDVAAALIAGGAPTVYAVRVLAAQSALETARWSALYNWNLGNITTASSEDWYDVGTGLHFKSYTSLQDGATSFIAYISKINALGLAAAGDVGSYVNRLRAANYYGDSSESARANYYNGIVSLMREFGSDIPDAYVSKNNNTRLLTVGVVVAGVTAMALSALAYAKDKKLIHVRT